MDGEMDSNDVALSPGNESHAPYQSVRRIWSRLGNRQELVVLLLLLVISLFLSLWTDTFLTFDNLSNLARNFSWIAIVTFGQSLVIIIGGIDMSVGAIMALAGLITAYSMQVGLPLLIAVLAGLLTGGLVGWINGLIIARAKLPPFAVTLGTMGITRGIAYSLTGGWPVRDLPQNFRMMGQHDIPLGSWSLPVPVLFLLGTALVVGLLLDQMVLGRYIHTLSGGERALLLTGVNTVRITILVYTLCGLLAAFGGLLMTARLGVAAPTAANGYELDSIAAAVVGGTSLYGGVGSVLGAFLGAAILQTLRNGLVLLGFPAYGQTVAIGAMILGVILLDYWRRRH
jgi:ribose transport system permease protein